MENKNYDYFDEIVKYDPVNHYYLISKDELKSIKNNISKNEIKKLEAQLSLINASYESEKRSVIYKTKPIEGFDIKDYVSLATYFWPNPDTIDQLPYICLDGQANPEGDLYDKNNLRRLAYNVYYQSILYYITEDKSYYESMKSNIKYYFLDTLTGMNPNLNHGQMLKGVDLGRGIGIIDFTANFSYALWMIRQIYDLGLIEEDFKLEFDSWLKELLIWLNTSKLGKEESEKKNNHGTFYDFGRAMIAYFVNDKQHVLDMTGGLVKRMNEQIASDGSMPLELSRTKSISYSLMAFKGITDFSKIVEELTGKNLWNKATFVSGENADLNIAADYLFSRLVTKEKTWDYAQIVTFDEATLTPLIASCTKYIGSEYALFNSLDNTKIINKPLYTILSKIV